MDTKQDILKIVLAFHNDDDAGLTQEQEAYAFSNIHEEESEDIVEGKMIITQTLYKDSATGKFYEVTQARDNSGYWGDGESYEPEVRQVWRVPFASWKTVYSDPEEVPACVSSK